MQLLFKFKNKLLKPKLEIKLDDFKILFFNNCINII
jgi:hypothetical protein